MADLTGVTLQKNFFLRKLIGQGATADVYLAWDKARTTQLAVKVLHSDLAVDSRFQQMFKKEAEFMRELRHPNIVRLFDFGEDKPADQKKTVFIAMEYVNGRNLRNILADRKAPLSLGETTQILAAVCKALNYAHQLKVYHCDVKPANILIAQSEGNEISEKNVFLADFGVAHWALQQRGGGTPAYMAPELFLGAKVNEQADIYALGVTLYEMLTGGHLPFRGDTSSPGSSVRDRIAWEKANKPLPPLRQFNPNIPEAIVAIVERLLNKDPKLRYLSTIDIWKSFEALEEAGIKEKKPISEQPTVFQMPPVQKIETPKHISSNPSAKVNQPYIVGITGEKAGKIIPLSGTQLTIGRHSSNELRLEDSTVSRYHATILNSNREYYIRDENSSIGTFLNGKRIPPNLPIILKNGDRISISKAQNFEFRITKATR